MGRGHERRYAVGGGGERLRGPQTKQVDSVPSTNERLVPGTYRKHTLQRLRLDLGHAFLELLVNLCQALLSACQCRAKGLQYCRR